jgi:hypothetical protein
MREGSPVIASESDFRELPMVSSNTDGDRLLGDARVMINF